MKCSAVASLHETCHGLGFGSQISYSGGILTNTMNPNGFIYDWFLFSGMPGGFPSSRSSAAPGTLTGQAATNCVTPGAITFQGTVGGASNMNFPVYTPTTFAQGSSLSHVDIASSSTSNRLMYFSISPGEINHDIGGFVWSAFASFGYDMKNCSLFTGSKSNSDCQTCIQNYCEWCYQDSFCGDSEAPNFWSSYPGNTDPGTCSASNGWLNNTAWCGNGGTTLSTTTLAAATSTLGCITKIDPLTGKVTCSSSTLLSFLF